MEQNEKKYCKKYCSRSAGDFILGNRRDFGVGELRRRSIGYGGGGFDGENRTAR